jgi:hypothetical protein
MKYLLYETADLANQANHRFARAAGMRGCQNCEPRCPDCTGDTSSTVYRYAVLANPETGQAALCLDDDGAALSDEQRAVMLDELPWSVPESPGV